MSNMQTREEIDREASLPQTAYDKAIHYATQESLKRAQANKKPPIRTRICIALLRVIEPPEVSKKMPYEILIDEGWTMQEINTRRGTWRCIRLTFKRLKRAVWELMWIKTTGGI